MADMVLHQETKTSPPTVTVAIPVYNGGRHLRLAVLSIVKQTFTDWELLLIDDGSTDNSFDEIADIRDDRIRIIRDGKNKGLAARLNEAVDLARGRYLARMDQDDVSYPERFERQVEALEGDSQLDLVAVRALAIDEDNHITGMLPCPATDREISANPWRGFYLCHPSWMGKIEWFRKYRYREPGPYFCEDQELLLRSHDESRFEIIREPLFAYRVRRDTQWRKLIKTRLTFLSLQVNYFLSKKLFLFAFLALLTAAGRSVLDVLRAVWGISYPILNIQEGHIFHKWNGVLAFHGDVNEGAVPSEPVNASYNPFENAAPVLWVLFFCYAICAALIFQKLLLPLIPSFHGGGGLLSNDAVYFNSLASEIAESIRINGWDSWQPFHVPGNVAIISALYAIFGEDPAWIIPVNAAVHALGGLCIFLLARELSGGKLYGMYAGIVASSCFILFPSALNWYGQLHKDGYAIAGTLLILLTWVRALSGPRNLAAWLLLTSGSAFGVFMVGSVRPYNLQLLFWAAIGVCLAIVVGALLRRQIGKIRVLMVFFLFSAVASIGFAFLIGQGGQHFVPDEMLYAGWESKSWQWQWQNSDLLPDKIEKYFEVAARTRAGLIEYGLSEQARSMIDADVRPQQTIEVVRYLPRALQVAVFAPFPSAWFSNLSITRLVATGEMFIFYLSIPGLLFLLWYNRRPAVWLCLYFSCYFLMIQGFIISNLGTLFRLRYGYFFVILLLGVLGWVLLLSRSSRIKKLVQHVRPAAPVVYSDPKATPVTGLASGRRQVVEAGLGVMFLTFLCFVGFFLRDIMMAQSFGLGALLDHFFIALLIPMFIVTVLYIPLGSAFVPVYVDARERLGSDVLQELVSNVSSWTGVTLLGVCFALYLVGPKVLSFVSLKIGSPDMVDIIPLLHLALPILLFSGIVIIGNSILNANGRAVFASGAQLIVPVTAILALVLFGNRHGVKAVMYGMIIGQLLNLFIVQYVLKGDNLWILPRSKFHYQEAITRLLAQYWPLALSALFVSLVIPVATVLAMLLPDGNVSAFNLGTKIVVFITGLVSAAMTAVILPYFAALISRNQLVEARRELSFFLLSATLISIPLSAVLFLWSEPIVRLVFERGSFDIAATARVALVMQYSIVQLPFFICNILLLKFATAARQVIVISLATFIGLLINISAGLLLMQHMGVGGIALGASLSVLGSTFLLLMFHAGRRYITGIDTVIVILSWMLFITLLMCIHFQNLPGIYITIFAYVLLLVGYVRSLMSRHTFIAKASI